METPLQLVKDEIRKDAEAARQRGSVDTRLGRRGAPAGPERIQPPRSEYTIDELCRSHFTAFLDQAFSALLRRPPDPAGFEAQMRLLVAGRSKIEILGNLRWSREGRDVGVHVPWLLPRYLLSKAMRIPLLGYLLEWVICLGGLPRIVHHQRAADTYHGARREEIRQVCRSIMDNVEVLCIEVARLGSDNPELSAKLKYLFDRVSPLQSELERVSNEARELRHLVLSMNHWLASLRQNLSALELAEAEQERHSDVLYADVATRVLAADPGRSARLQSWATQLAEGLPARAQTLDLCSGDDWLACLVSCGLEATGVDTNSRIGMRATAAGLAVTVADPPAVLARTADQSLQAITVLGTGSLLRNMSAKLFLESARRVLVRNGWLLLGFEREPASIAARLEGRAAVDLDGDLMMQTLRAAGFVDVRPLPASDGSVCIVARNVRAMQ